MVGRVDCIAEYNGVPSIIDFKTSKSERNDDWNLDYYIQASAYAEMFEERTGTPIESDCDSCSNRRWNSSRVCKEEARISAPSRRNHRYSLSQNGKKKMKHWMNGDVIGVLFSGHAIAQDPEIPQSKPQMPTTYWAQKPIQCSNMETLIEMTKSYGEVPTIYMDGQTGFPNGLTTPSKFVISLNPKTETWTFIEFVSDEHGSVFLVLDKVISH